MNQGRSAAVLKLSADADRVPSHDRRDASAEKLLEQISVLEHLLATLSEGADHPDDRQARAIFQQGLDERRAMLQGI